MPAGPGPAGRIAFSTVGVMVTASAGISSAKAERQARQERRERKPSQRPACFAQMMSLEFKEFKKCQRSDLVYLSLATLRRRSTLGDRIEIR